MIPVRAQCARHRTGVCMHSNRSNGSNGKSEARSGRQRAAAVCVVVARTMGGTWPGSSTAEPPAVIVLPSRLHRGCAG
eukprot:5606898-Prymnesium_polylepis.1